MTETILILAAFLAGYLIGKRNRAEQHAEAMAHATELADLLRSRAEDLNETADWMREEADVLIDLAAGQAAESPFGD